MDRKWFRLWNFERLRSKWLDMLALGRTLALLAAGSLLFFVLLGAGGMAGQKLGASPAPFIKGMAASLSSAFFTELLGMEVPHLPKPDGESPFSGAKITSFVFQLLTSVDPHDPKSLLSREVPGMAADNPVLLRTGSGGGGDAPADYHPGASELAADDGQGADGADDAGGDPAGGGGTEPEDGTAGGGQEEGNGTGAGGDNGSAASPGGGTAGQGGQSAGPGSGAAGQQGVNGEADLSLKRVLIYHSHPREAYNPLLGNNTDNPSSASPTKNVMLVGSFMADRLEKHGIGVVHSQDDYATQVEDYSWNYSYKYSRMTVKAAMAQHDGLDMMIDIHRDSQRHGKTTAVIGGQSYAQVYFIIGRANENWKENEAFANSIHQVLEKNYPGLSRGIWGKDSGKGNNGEYNQSLSPGSILLEVGGIDNTEEELRRTAEVVADTVAELYWQSRDAEKAGAQGN